MLDENLPAFFLRPSSSGIRHHRDFFLSHNGSDPAPAYTLRHADPASTLPAHKNCYAAALFDAYNPDVLFGEVLARPGWTQPSLSAEELRRHGGVSPSAQPLLPNDFIVQLYNPDQQVRVEVKEGKWGASDVYEFSMPVSTFRTPSASNLDRGQSDPAGLATTPKLSFAWRKESKLSKDLTCSMTGWSTDTSTKKKNSRKDPDITVAYWRSLRELTIYDTNLSRLDMEDPKGLEVALLLSAVVIKDLYFGSRDHLREVFNVTDDPTARKLSAGGRRLSNPPPPRGTLQTPNDTLRQTLPKLQTTARPTHPHSQHHQQPPPPPLDPETARLRAQADAEASQARRARRDRERADEAEARRLQRLADDEDRAARRRQADIDKETERLRKKYGVQPVQANSSSSRHQPHHRPSHGGSSGGGSYSQSTPRHRPLPAPSSFSSSSQQRHPQQRPKMGSNGLYVQSSASSSSLMMSGGNGNPSSSQLDVSRPPRAKKSFWGLKSSSDEAGGGGGNGDRERLRKNESSVW
ncbi:hypothetical protein B0A50_08698 [Salinomyces thailandicus]|uniref:Uncharacterized protein n=1 Tax=Salinomyces thailandicus TaxID=706561 RepID=A0A4U0TJ65_9PEZI|nr:hypothetical protein B0A50_08698 [Salinomyces thailandica]